MNIGNIKVESIIGDITQQADINAIINASNAELQIGRGVAGVLHSAASPALAEECKPLAPISPGGAVIKGGHKLPNKYIIHTLGPIYGFNQPELKLLTKCYENALNIAEQNNIESIAFPAISTGAFGYPFKETTEIALSTFQNFIPKAKSIKLIRFVLFSEKDFEHYQNQLNSIK